MRAARLAASSNPAVLTHSHLEGDTMAHFRAVIQGARGEASRLGHKKTGISTLLQTWGWDVRVTCEHQNEQDSATGRQCGVHDGLPLEG